MFYKRKKYRDISINKNKKYSLLHFVVKSVYNIKAFITAKITLTITCTFLSVTIKLIHIAKSYIGILNATELCYGNKN